MDFSEFDTGNDPTVSVEEGYGECAATYENVSSTDRLKVTRLLTPASPRPSPFSFETLL